MKVETKLVELPGEQKVMDEIVGDGDHEVKTVSLSSVVHEGQLKHFALVVWPIKARQNTGIWAGRAADLFYSVPVEGGSVS